MKFFVTALCAGAMVVATASPGFALMKGNAINPDYKSKYSSGSGMTSTDMTKPPRTAKKSKKR